MMDSATCSTTAGNEHVGVPAWRACVGVEKKLLCGTGAGRRNVRNLNGTSKNNHRYNETSIIRVWRRTKIILTSRTQRALLCTLRHLKSERLQ